MTARLSTWCGASRLTLSVVLMKGQVIFMFQAIYDYFARGLLYAFIIFCWLVWLAIRNPKTSGGILTDIMRGIFRL